MIYLYDKTGKPVPIEDAQVREALASGELFLPKGGTNVFNPKGELVSIDAANVPRALQTGYRLETQEEKQQRRAEEDLGGLGAKAASLGAAAARGATLGLSDVLLTESGLVHKETLRQLKEGFPATSVIGEIGGAAAPAFLTGGETAVARGAEMLPAGIASRLGAGVSGAVLEKLAAKGLQGTVARNMVSRAIAGATAGAAEGALFGAGGAVSEYALGQTDELGEALVAHVGPAALLGGGLGGSFGLVGSLAGDAARATAKRLRGVTRDRPQALVVSGISSFTRGSREAVNAQVNNWGDDLVWKADELLFKGGAVPEAGTYGPLLKGGLSAREQAARVMSAADHWGGVLGRARQLVEERGGRLDPQILGGELLAAIEEAAPKVQTGPLRKAVRRLKQDAKRLAQKGEELSPVDLQEFKFQLDEGLTTARRSGANSVARLNMKVRDTVAGLQDDLMKATLEPAEMEAYKHAMDVYKVMGKLRGLAKKGPSAQAIGQAFERMQRYALARTAWQLAGAGIGGAGRALTSGLALFGGARVAGEIGGASGPAILRHRLSNMMTLQKAQEAVDGRIVKAVSRFLRGVRRSTTPASAAILNRFTGKRDRPEGFRKAKEVILGWQSDPETTATMLSANLGGLAHAAPESTRFATEATARARQYLAESIPPPAPSLQPHLEAERPGDVRAFSEKLVGAAAPLEAIDDLGDLNMSYTEVQAFRMTYPALAAKLEGELLAALADWPRRLTYAQAFQLSMFLGRPVSPELSGPAIAKLQMVHQQPMTGQPRPPSAKGTEFENIHKTRMGASTRMEMPV